MSLDVLNPLIIKRHKPKGGFCLVKADSIDNLVYSPINYDFGLITDSWTIRNNHGPIRSTASVIYDGKIYNFGGTINGVNPIAQFSCYTPETDSWAAPVNITGDVAKNGHMVVYDQNREKFMSFGGSISGGTIVSSVKSALAATPNVWTSGTPQYSAMPAARSGLTGGIWDGKVYCWGGGPTNLSIYNIETNLWSIAANSTTPTVIPLPATINTENGILYQAGWSSGENTMSVWSFSLGSGVDQYVWKKHTCVTTKPAIRQRYTFSYTNGVLYMIGGRLYNSPGTVVNEIWAYNISHDVWMNLNMDNLKVGTEYASAEVLHNKIYNIGGNINSGVIIGDHHYYDLSKSYSMAIRLVRG